MGDQPGHLVVGVDLLDHRGPVDTERTTPYVGTEHAILLALVSDCWNSQELGRGWPCSRQGQVRAPTDAGEPLFSDRSSAPDLILP